MTLPPAADHTHVVHNGKRDVPIDELARWQPGMDRLMAELGPRMHRLAYAGRAGNWRLAEYFYKSVVKQLHLCGASRPKYAEDIDRYVERDCRPVLDALRAGDATAFDAAWAVMVRRANDYHDQYGKPYLHWVLPATPPDDLDLRAGLDG